MRKLQLVLVAVPGLGADRSRCGRDHGRGGADRGAEQHRGSGVVGYRQDGELLAAKDGEWSGTDPMTFTYQWQGCDGSGANCANISGATGKVYRVATSDVGKRLRVQVTARNSSGTDTAMAPASSAVIHPTGATRLADGRYSIPATSVKEPFRLVISGVEFIPSVLRSRQSSPAASA